MIEHHCPFCSFPLLRHVSTGKLYWFCRHCYQEVPFAEEVVNTATIETGNSRSHELVNLALSQPLHHEDERDFSLMAGLSQGFLRRISGFS